MIEQIDSNILRNWFYILQVIWGAAVGIYVYFATRRKHTDQRFIDMEHDFTDRLSVIRTRIGTLEKSNESISIRINQMPTHSDIKTLSDSISHLAGKVNGIGRTVDIIHEYLINQGGRNNK